MRAKAKIICLLLCLSFGACSEKKKIDEKITFRNILILGNSITHSRPDPNIGWYGDWGMAASSKENDFVHILISRFKEERADAIINFRNISDYEASFWNYDLSNLDSLKNLNPDLILFRIAENVPDSVMDQYNFGASYLKLIEYFQQNNLNVKIICASSFWNQPRTAKYISDLCLKKGYPLVELYKVSEDIKSTAWGNLLIQV